jgi:hypothetical protein
MKGYRRQRREELAFNMRDIMCDRCGRVLEGEAAFGVHADPDGCLPDGAYGQLVPISGGRWGLRYKHPRG